MSHDKALYRSRIHTEHERSVLPHASKVLFLRWFMVALWNRETIYIFMLWFVMVALCNRADHYIFILFLLLSSSFFFLSFFCSPNLSGRRLDVYHTLAHGVALVRI